MLSNSLPIRRRVLVKEARDASLVLDIESLEHRCLLAGTVEVVELGSGAVVLKGDTLDNAVAIQVAADGSWRLLAEDGTSLLWMDEAQTELAWSTARPLVVRLRGGNDRLVISGPSSEQQGRWQETLILQGATGDDDISLSHLSLSATLVVSTNSGRDSVRLVDVNSASAGRIISGASDDAIHLEDAHFDGDLLIQTVHGEDVLAFAGNVSAEQMRIGLGSGRDLLRLGDARATVDIISDATIRLGGGNDELLSLANPNVSTVSYLAGGGRDRLLATPSFSGDYVGFETLSILGELDEVGALQLSAADADYNTQLIESYVLNGEHAIIPAGSWPVRPISIGSNGQLSGLGVGVSELRLEITSPSRDDPQHVVATAPPTEQDGFTRGVVVRDLTLNGNYEDIDWSGVYGDGKAFGLDLRAAADSIFTALEIKNCWTDGIYVASVLNEANNSRDCLFTAITIHHCGRQGVSIVGGEHLLLNDFSVYAIGRGDGLGTSPRSALDIEPEFDVGRLVRHITVSNWEINHVGQGILVSATNSAEQATDILLENIFVADMNGPQILAVRDVEGIVVRNFHGEDHQPAAGGVGVLFRNSTGEVDGLTIIDSQGTNYPLRIDGDSDLDLRNVIIDGAARGALQIGSEPGQTPAATNVRISSFAFRHIANSSGGLPLGRIQSTGNVVLTDGLIADMGNTNYTFQLFSDATFVNCDFASGSSGIFDPTKPGQPLGSGNNWN